MDGTGGKMVEALNVYSYSAGIDFSRQNLTSTDFSRRL